MDTARQVIRWSIPGSVFVAVLALCGLLLAVAWGYAPQDVLTSRLVVGTGAAGLIFLAAAAIPIGFFIYQLYYAYQSRGIIWRKKGYVKLDHGSELFKALGQRHYDYCYHVCGEWPTIWRTRPAKIGGFIPTLQLLDAVRGPAATYGPDLPPPREVIDDGTIHPSDPSTTELLVTDFQNGRERNRHLFKSYMDYACQGTERSSLKAEYTTLLDLYHALGACRVAAMLAGAVTLAYGVGSYGRYALADLFGIAVGVLIITVMVALIVYVFNSTRQLCWRSALYTVSFDLQWLLPERRVRTSLDNGRRRRATDGPNWALMYRNKGADAQEAAQINALLPHVSPVPPDNARTSAFKAPPETVADEAGRGEG